MQKLIELFLQILKDEQGEVNWLTGEGILWGGDDEEEDDPYAALRSQYQNYLSGKLGTSTPYTYNSAFDIQQPTVESAAEKTILGYLENPTTNVSDYSEATKKYSEAAKASRAETYADEMKKTQNMYNRLGLVSSTPGLTAEADLNRKQATEANLFDTELAYQNLDRQLTAQGLDVSQLSSMLGQATNLGKTQRASQQYSQQASESDIARMVGEEQTYASLLSSLLGQNPEDTTYTPNTLEQLLSTGADILPYLLMMMA